MRSRRPAQKASSARAKTIAELLDDALEKAGITQYELAKRMSALRGTHLGSQDQALRRIRRYGQAPGEDVARDLARAFSPELKLAGDHFISARKPDVREAARQALAEVELLQGRVADLEAEVDRLSKRASPRPAKATSSRRR